MAESLEPIDHQEDLGDKRAALLQYTMQLLGSGVRDGEASH